MLTLCIFLTSFHPYIPLIPQVIYHFIWTFSSSTYTIKTPKPVILFNCHTIDHPFQRHIPSPYCTPFDITLPRVGCLPRPHYLSRYPIVCCQCAVNLLQLYRYLIGLCRLHTYRNSFISWCTTCTPPHHTSCVASSPTKLNSQVKKHHQEFGTIQPQLLILS